MENTSLQSVLLEDGAQGDFDLFRRPGILARSGGRLIAYYEGQITGEEKRQSLFCRTSEDGGRSWSGRIVLASGGEQGMLHNVMMADVDGLLHCFWNVQYRQLWHSSSADGSEWSAPEDWTDKLQAAETPYPWNAFGIGSGHIVRLRSGRALIPTWFTTGGDSHKPSAFANIYADDGFETLQIGAMLASNEQIFNPNEGAVVELSDGRVLATVRHDGQQRQRVFAVSEDGAGDWRAPVYRQDLPDPICHASFTRDPQSGAIFFCNCANADEGAAEKKRRGLIQYNWSDDARKNLTLRISRDDGRSFSQGVLLAEKGGYSDIAVTEDQSTVACIYETGWGEDNCIFPRQIGLAILPAAALEERA